MGETENLNFHDFEIFERVLEPQNQYDSSLETPGHLKEFKKLPNPFWKYYCCKSQNFGNPTCWDFGKRRTQTSPDEPSHEFWKILYMNSISITNMKWKFGNTNQVIRCFLKSCMDCGWILCFCLYLLFFVSPLVCMWLWYFGFVCGFLFA